jgi:hypothetical protein
MTQKVLPPAAKGTIMSEKLDSETPTMRKRLVRLRVGARFWMDFRGWTWPDCPHGDADLVFAAFRSGVDNKSTLRGQGFDEAE